MRFRTLMIMATVLCAAGAPAMAQTSDDAAPPPDCQAKPPAGPTENSGNNGNGQKGNVDPGQTGSTSLSDTLGSCDGVLRPPPVGDQEIAKPAPETGEMPVIKPHQLPGQQSNPEQQ